MPLWILVSLKLSQKIRKKITFAFVIRGMIVLFFLFLSLFVFARKNSNL